VDEGPGIPCVIYAAKSTEDRKGSIPDQLRECRASIDADPGRRCVADYTDEAFSAFRRDRGPGLRDAMQHAEDLALERGIAELWAQHSDRLARGDGRKARHTVEVALWALKHDVKVHTVQDPDTFRDLLYAVVTGERNNEDFRRKALAAQAGRKRAIARGEYVGHLPDGYRVAVEVDERSQVTKRMALDPGRQPLIELIFRLALRGRNCGQIATSVNNAGWLTKPVKTQMTPVPFDVGRVYEILKNPRYAALAAWKGEVLARGCWPAYITERQHEKIKRQLATPRPTHARRPLESYLLTGLARCGACGHPLNARTWRQRDGGLHRTYLCASYSRHRGSLRCKAPPLDAHTAEAMVIAALGGLLATTAPGVEVPRGELHTSRAADPATAGCEPARAPAGRGARRG
jgi:Recombinase zinc beta ribbon domain/Resolvase, N terminal domain/Recombinase